MNTTQQQPMYQQQQPMYGQQPMLGHQQPMYGQQPMLGHQQPMYGQQPMMGQQPMYGQPQQQPQQKDDMLDKGLAMLQKKNGQKVDKQKNEKITDFIRKMFTMVTGKKVPHAVSN